MMVVVSAMMTPMMTPMVTFVVTPMVTYIMTPMVTSMVTFVVSESHGGQAEEDNELHSEIFGDLRRN